MFNSVDDIISFYSKEVNLVTEIEEEFEKIRISNVLTTMDAVDHLDDAETEDEEE